VVKNLKELAMRRFLHPACVIILLAVSLFAQNMNAPSISFDTQTKEFGKVLEGEKLKHVFRFVNKGTQTLQVQSVLASCGCTSTLLSKKSIKAGQEGQIEVVVDTSGRAGALNKTVTVTSNDPLHQQVVLTITAQVEPEFALSQPSVFFGSVPKGQEVIKEITITVQSPKPVSLLSVESNDPEVTVRMEQVPNTDGRKYRLIAVQKADAKEGYHYGTFAIKTTSETTPVLRIPERGNVGIQPKN
jgi:hypothetical protein